MSALESYILTKILDSSWKFLLGKIKKSKFKIRSNKVDFENSLNYHMKGIKNFCSTINFKQSNRIKNLNDIYIDIDLYLNPLHLSSSKKNEKVSSSELMQNIDTNLVIFGQAGAGKTTLLKKICANLLFEPERIAKDINFPLLIELNTLHDFYSPLKDVDTSVGPLIEKFIEITGIIFEYPEIYLKRDSFHYIKTFKERCLIELLDSMNPIIVLDGFDEIDDFDLRELVVNDLKLIAKHSEHTKLLLTTRIGEFGYFLNNTSQFEISDLSEEQITEFTFKWFKNDGLAKKFLVALYQSPFKDTSIRPLNISHLCAVYEKSASFPDKPSDLYKRIVNLLIEEWDYERNIKRKSKYQGFFREEKFRFLCHLAYHLSISYSSLEYTHDDIIETFLLINDFFSLPKSDAIKVINELESHTGLFLRITNDKYKFSHKSIQEYLVAEYLKNATRSLEHLYLNELPYESAIAIWLSTNNLHAFYEYSVLTLNRCDDYFIRKLLHRLIEENPRFILNGVQEKMLFLASLMNIMSSFWFNEIRQYPYYNKKPSNVSDDELLIKFFKQEYDNPKKWITYNKKSYAEIIKLLDIIKNNSHDEIPYIKHEYKIVDSISLDGNKKLNLIVNKSPVTNLKNEKKYLMVDNIFLKKQYKLLKK